MKENNVMEMKEEMVVVDMNKLNELSKEELILLVMRGKGSGRKNEVLKLLKDGRISIEDIAKKIGIERRNVSTLLSYIRKDGYNLGKDSKGRIYIEED